MTIYVYAILEKSPGLERRKEKQTEGTSTIYDVLRPGSVRDESSGARGIESVTLGLTPRPRWTTAYQFYTFNPLCHHKSYETLLFVI